MPLGTRPLPPLVSFSTFHFFSCVVSRVPSAGHDACSLVFISGCCGCPWLHGRPRRDGSCWGCGTRWPHFSYFFLCSSTRINGNSPRGDEQRLRQRHGWRRVAHQKQAATGRLHCQGRRLSHQSTGDDASVIERKEKIGKFGGARRRAPHARAARTHEAAAVTAAAMAATAHNPSHQAYQASRPLALAPSVSGHEWPAAIHARCCLA